MPRAVKVSARAASEVRAAAAWWAANRPAAVGAIAADFGESLRLLAEQPGIGSRYAGIRTPGVRRLHLNRVGYFVYYIATDADLRVLAFWHASREQQPAL